MVNTFEFLNRNTTTNVYMIGDQCIKSFGEGQIKIKVQVDKKHTNSIELKNVIYVPELRNNLLSVSAITNKGYTVKFDQKGTSVKHDDGTTALTATKRGQLYIMNQKNNHCAMNTSNDNNNLLR